LTPLEIKREWWEPEPVGKQLTRDTYSQRRYEVVFRCECGEERTKYILAEDMHPDDDIKRMIRAHELADDPQNKTYRGQGGMAQREQGAPPQGEQAPNIRVTLHTDTQTHTHTHTHTHAHLPFVFKR
jgi:hypothetical protein